MAREGTKRKSAGSTERLLAEVVAGQRLAAAAKAAGMGEETARRRLREPEVAERLNELRALTLATAADRLTSIALGAAVTLGNIASDPNVAPGVRVRAADAILSRVVGFRDASITEDRLAAIERHLEAQRQVQAAHGLRLAVTR